MRICILGGAGFIGSTFTRNLLAGEYSDFLVTHLFILDKLTYAGNLRSLSKVMEDKRVTFVQGDICDSEVLDSLLPRVDIVINFAAESHVDRSIKDATPFVMSNVLGAVRVMESCVKNRVSRLVHVSTDEVYGSVDQGLVTETDSLTCNSPYSASKGAADLFARAFHKTYGLDVIVTRCSNNYGPYQYPEKLIPLFITNLILGRNLPLYGNGLNIREWIHVDDHCRAIAMLAHRGIPGEIYNIGSGFSCTNLVVAQLLCEIFGVSDDVVEFVDDRLGHDKRYALDFTKVFNLGFDVEITFEEGLQSTVDWYKQNQSWWTQTRKSIP